MLILDLGIEKLKNKHWSQTSQKVLKIQISKELRFFFYEFPAIFNHLLTYDLFKRQH